MTGEKVGSAWAGEIWTAAMVRGRLPEEIVHGPALVSLCRPKAFELQEPTKAESNILFFAHFTQRTKNRVCAA